MDQAEDRSAERERMREIMRRVKPGRIEIMQWGGFQPPWKKGPITTEPPTRSRWQSRPSLRS